MSKKYKKISTKIKLPTDRNGMPIDVGCVMMFDHDCVKVESLTYYGDAFKSLGYQWTANVGDDEIDNLAGGEVIWRP